MKKIILLLFILASLVSSGQLTRPKPYKDQKKVDSLGVGDSVITPAKIAQWTAGGAGGGTVNSGTANQLTYYGATGTAVSGTAAWTLSGTNLSGNGNKIVSIADGSAATDAVSKQQLDAIASGITYKTAARAATTGAGTLATSFENGDAIDGVTLATNDRILIKDQSDQTENGIYSVAASGAPTRTTDADAGSELSAGASVFVSSGTANAGTQWTQSTTGTITLGSSNIVFVNIGNAAGALLASNNLSDVSTPATARTNLGATIVGSNLFTLANPSAVRFLRINADNTVTPRTAAELLGDIGAQASGSYATSGANTDITSVLLNQTGLVVKGASANALTIKPNETLSAGRTLNILVNDADKTINLGGNIVTSGAINTAAAFTTSGANALTLTTTGSTNVTLPTTGTLATLAGTETFTNKRITKRVNTNTTVTSPLTMDSDSYDVYVINALDGSLTFSAPSGTPTSEQDLYVTIQDNGSFKNLTWNAAFRASPDLPLPTVTVAGKYMRLKFTRNANETVWDFVGYLNNL